MKIAIILCGHLRSFKHNVDSQIKHFYGLHDCDIFLSSWDNFGEFPVHESIHHKRWDDPTKIAKERHLLSQEDVDYVLEKLTPVNYEFENPEECVEIINDVVSQCPNTRPGPPTHVPFNYVSMHYKNAKGFNMVVDSINQGKHYDLVIRTRPDCIFYDDVIFPAEVNQNTVYTPIINCWGAMNDQLAFGDINSMYSYFNMLPNIPVYSEQLGHIHPETSIMYHIKKCGHVLSPTWNVNYDVIRSEMLDMIKTYEEAKLWYEDRVRREIQ